MCLIVIAQQTPWQHQKPRKRLKNIPQAKELKTQQGFEPKKKQLQILESEKRVNFKEPSSVFVTKQNIRDKSNMYV